VAKTSSEETSSKKPSKKEIKWSLIFGTYQY
jgi:hypothetical protein